LDLTLNKKEKAKQKGLAKFQTESKSQFAPVLFIAKTLANIPNHVSHKFKT
tara:strand:- start:377 stop:529 length:153 start_codon:yes stop_codon:yes gene_type:complete